LVFPGRSGSITSTSHAKWSKKIQIDEASIHAAWSAGGSATSWLEDFLKPRLVLQCKAMTFKSFRKTARSLKKALAGLKENASVFFVLGGTAARRSIRCGGLQHF